MNENENVGFEDFESALFGNDYQIGDDSEPEAVETDDTEVDDVSDDSGTDADSDADEETGSDEEKPADEAEDSEESDAEDKGEKTEDPKTDQQMFTLKVNKEEQQVTLEEMTALAQKGADYDRVKENYTKSQQTVQDMQARLDTLTAHQSTLEILAIVAEKTGASMDELAESIYVNIRKSAGASEDAAKEELKSAKLEKKSAKLEEELSSYKSQKQQPEDDADSRAKRDMEEFQKEYPDVQLSGKLIKSLTPDIKNGMSLSAAYRKFERQQAADKIAELERKLAAKAQNDKNKTSSPGSQKDSGGRRTKDSYDDFMSAFN